ncbi:hypothetical protein TCAL_14857 [Tigriopus californicus]|uniref:DUF5641 domain-containing protein n=1 Tax=Tigriopus californicus TaxID=6832 RepID=A0A553P2M6_TIGCA|nr:hypothetical protein TCAL_14857 [Tigriopus californicus]
MEIEGPEDGKKIGAQDQNPSQVMDLTSKEGQVLGLTWNLREDSLGFALKNFKVEDIVFTRRGLLRKLAGVFDPIGLAAPFIVKGKIMMQGLSKMAKEWDEKLDSKDVEVWRDIEAFAAVAYVRNEMQTGEIKIRLVMSKTRVVPVKPISIAKLELNGAVLGARIIGFLERTFRQPINRRVLWTDSTAVLGWIQATASYYKPFVSNWVGEIQMLSSTRDWRHVPGAKNPADLATRSNFKGPVLPDLWLNGPEFLMEKEINWPEMKTVQKNKEEIKNEFNTFEVVLVAEEKTWFDRIKSWEEAKQKMREESEDPEEDEEVALIGQSQKRVFPEDLQCLQAKLPLKNNSKLRQLNPFLDAVGLIRCPNKIIPAGQFASKNPRYHFRFVQGLVDQIWDRWTKEYLPTLLSRSKWNNVRRNLVVGDQVMILEPNLPRGEWKIGKVEETYPGKDGLVRAATVKLLDGSTKTRPLTKLCIIQKKEEGSEDSTKKEEEDG